jgi:hypothetical protein
MAGGMNRRSGPTLAERAAASATAAGLRQPARHCWVVDLPGQPGRWPGLLLEWRRERGDWHGRVAYAVPDQDGARMVEHWLPARCLVAETGAP